MDEKLIRKQQGQRLTAARIAAGFKSARQAAERFGWAYSTYGAHERGTRTIGIDDAEKYVKRFRALGVDITARAILFAHEEISFDEYEKAISSAELGLGRDKRDVIIEADVRSGAGAGGVSHSELRLSDSNGNTFAAEGIAGEWSLPQQVMSGMLHASPQHILAFEVIGDSMEPRLRSGDRVFVDRRMNYPNPEGIFVLWDGYSVVVKQLQIVRGTEPQRLRVISANQQYQPYEVLADEINIIGRYVGRFTTD